MYVIDYNRISITNNDTTDKQTRVQERKTGKKDQMRMGELNKKETWRKTVNEMRVRSKKNKENELKDQKDKAVSKTRKIKRRKRK